MTTNTTNYVGPNKVSIEEYPLTRPALTVTLVSGQRVTFLDVLESIGEADADGASEVRLTHFHYFKTDGGVLTVRYREPGETERTVRAFGPTAWLEVTEAQ